MLIIVKRNLWIIALVLLAACGPVSQASPTVAHMTKTAAFYPIAILTPTVAATKTPPPTETPAPTKTLSLTPIPLPPFSLDSLRMVYVKDGNLYLQDVTNQPIQLTHSGKDRDPIISDDGKKIVFYRGKINDNNVIYSVNPDGSQEQAIITNDWLTTLGVETKAGHLAFVPDTHQLFFDTYLCSEDLSFGCTVGLYQIDADTKKIKEFLAPSLGGYLPWGGGESWGGNFSVSPDGKFLSIALAGHISIFNTDGKIVYRNIVAYTRSTPIELFPRMFWLPDSRGLIIALPAESNYGGGYETRPTYTVWRYKFNDNTALQIPLDPLPMWIYMECGDIIYPSPNGDWVTYSRLTDEARLYAGNLGNGNAQSYAMDVYCPKLQWSLDNEHFIYGHLGPTFLGAIGKPPIGISGVFLGWIDAGHYIYVNYPDRNILVGEIDKETVKIYTSGVLLQENYYAYSLTFVVMKP